MKVLLINPNNRRIVSPSYMKTIQEGVGVFPPLGILYIAGYLLKKSSHRVKVLDALLEDMDIEALKKEVVEFSPDVVGISAITLNLLEVLLTAKAVKEVNPSIRVVVGGPHTSLYPHQTVSLEGVDYVIVGEGEIPFHRLLDYLEKPKDSFPKDMGILSKEGGDVTPYVNFNLDHLPFPARHLVPYKKYRSVVSTHPPFTTIMGSRGCPYQCTFCYTAGGKIFRGRTPKNILEEVKECIELGIYEFFFFDENFTLKKERVEEFCHLILKEGLKIYWDVRSRVDHGERDMLKLMKEAGCQRIQFGVESGSQKILNRLKKGFSVEQAQKAFKWAKEAGILTYADFMIGNPDETMEDIEKTLKFAQKLDPDYVHFSITMPLPHTKLYQEALERGIIKEDYWQQFAKNPTQQFKVKYWEENFTSEQLEMIIDKAYKSFYLRSRYIIKSLMRLKSLGELWQKGKAALKLLKL